MDNMFGIETKIYINGVWVDIETLTRDELLLALKDCIRNVQNLTENHIKMAKMLRPFVKMVDDMEGVNDK